MVCTIASCLSLNASERFELEQLYIMGDVDEAARMWKVNRTIHELVRDRVSYSICFMQHTLIRVFDVGIHGV